jgi:hypothetical protein
MIVLPTNFLWMPPNLAEWKNLVKPKILNI